MRVAISSDERAGIAPVLGRLLEDRGHEVVAYGALAPAPVGGREARAEQWAWASERAARDVAAGRAEAAIVCCWTGTGASIAANKVPGVRAALCADAVTAEGARRWNDANVLAVSLRSTSEAELEEIVSAFLGTSASTEEDDRANVEHVRAIELAGAREAVEDR